MASKSSPVQTVSPTRPATVASFNEGEGYMPQILLELLN